MKMIVMLLLGGVVGTAAADPAWIDEQIEAGAIVGLSIADVVDGEVSYHGHGRISGDRPTAPDRHTRYEIGSITKAFTNLLLAELVAKGVVDYDTTIAELVPQWTYANPQVGNITLEQLATHTSGLPRLPANLSPSNPDDPYADFGADDLRQALATVRADQTLAHQYAYSNLGVGLLGYLLGVATETDYETALRHHVLEPLGMNRTTPGCEGGNVAPGHSGGKTVPHWTLDALAGAGALCASTAELVKLVDVYLGDRSPLAHAVSADLEVQHPAGDMHVTRVWHVAERGGSTVYWHNGGTGGYRSFLGFDPNAGEAHILLSNSSADVTAYGLSLFGAATPAAAPAAVGDADLADYLGHFAITPSFTISVTREGGTLHAQATGQPRLTLAAAGDDRYSLLEVDAQLQFLRNEDGEVDALILHQGGMAQRAARVDAPATVRTFEAIEIDPAVLDDYPGRYRLAPGLEFVVTRDGNGLQAKLGGQPAYPIYPHAEDRFFYKVVDAQLTFNRTDGEVVSLTLHQNGMDQVAPRQ